MRANSLLSLTSLHDAARKGDSYALQQLITVIDPTAAKKVAAVLLQRENRRPVATSAAAAGTEPSLGKKVSVKLNQCSAEILRHSVGGSNVNLFRFQYVIITSVATL